MVSKVIYNRVIHSKDTILGILIELEMLKQTHSFQTILVALGRNAFCKTALPENAFPSSHVLCLRVVICITIDKHSYLTDS